MKWCYVALWVAIAFWASVHGSYTTTARQQTPRADGARLLEVPASGSLQNPAWSPDGAALLLTRFVAGYNAEPADLLVFQRESGTVRILFSDDNSNVNLPGPAWNAVTDEIVFSSTRGEHDEIYVIPADGNGTQQQITRRADRMAYEPTWSPDGQRIVFEAHPLETEGHGVITVTQRDGDGRYLALTPEDADCRQPNWSPAGDWIVFQCLEAGRWDLWIVHPDGTERQRLTDGHGDKTDASFSPDGRWIVYSGDAGTLEYANLFIVPTAGGKPVRLTHFNGYDGAPAWSPDGRWVAFEAAPADPDDANGTQLWMISVPRRFGAVSDTREK